MRPIWSRRWTRSRGRCSAWRRSTSRASAANDSAAPASPPCRAASCQSLAPRFRRTPGLRSRAMVAPRLEIPACDMSAALALESGLELSDALAQVLVRRGHAEPDTARAFLEAADEHSPAAFDGIDAAVALILGHVRAATRITIHGDYDVDGVCSTA